MARVFLAEEPTLGRRVVVKVLPPDVAHAFSAERFTREVQFSAQLQHPNIVPVLSANVAGDLPYYTMPFIEGESLRARIRRLGQGERIPRGECFDILRDVAKALEYAHSRGIVHRDIKPENILLAYNAAVVADFGIAKAIAAASAHGASSTGALTRAGGTLGTPEYMAPEQAAGDPMADQRVDIYAWGVIAYELLGGSHPFTGRKSVQAMITAHLADQPADLRGVAPSIPSRVTALVMRCLAKDPSDRPSSAREIVDALPAGAEGEKDSLHDDSRSSGINVAHSSARRWQAVTIAGLALAAIALWLTYANRADRSVQQSPAARASTSAISSSPAVDLYLRGKMLAASENRDDNDSAITVLREALRIDPALAPAYAGLSRAYTIKGFYFAADAEKKKLREDAEVAVNKALEIDPDLAEAHFARGLLLWTPSRRFPHEQAVQAYRQAITLDPRHDEAHHQLALVYLHIGLFDKAQKEIDEALRINPANSLARFRAGVLALYRNDFERARSVFNSTPLERNPSLWAFQMATVLFRLGRERDASELIDRFLADYPRDEGGVGHSVRAMILAKGGKRNEAQVEIDKAVSLGQNFGHFHHTAYNVASAYALLGDPANAVRFLENAADNGFPAYPLFNHDAQLDTVRKDSRFVQLMKRLERDWIERSRTL